MSVAVLKYFSITFNGDIQAQMPKEGIILS